MATTATIRMLAHRTAITGRATFQEACLLAPALGSADTTTADSTDAATMAIPDTAIVQAMATGQATVTEALLLTALSVVDITAAIAAFTAVKDSTAAAASMAVEDSTAVATGNSLAERVGAYPDRPRYRHVA
jgi:hypothetical protein